MCANEQTLNKIYTGLIRSHLEYCSAAWSTGANTHLSSGKVDSQALGIIAGATESILILAMLEVTGLQTVFYRRDSKSIIHMAKYISILFYYMKSRIEDSALDQLNRSRFFQWAKILQQQNQADLPVKTSLKPTSDETFTARIP